MDGNEILVPHVISVLLPELQNNTLVRTFRTWAQPLGSSAMTTWEYTTTVITHGFMGRQSDELNRKDLQDELSRLGADGWELATVFLDVNLHREKDGHVMVFKRRVD